MRQSSSGFAMAALLCCSFFGAPASAAPDNTLGMALMAAEVVGANGSLIRGSGATGASRSSEGLYVVTFDRDVTECFYSATFTNIIGLLNPGRTLQANTFNGNGVRVRLLRAADDTVVDADFQLIVFCPR
jgi:hypothetical protein